jgi:GNAT superfamily N-acetyltransferase
MADVPAVVLLVESAYRGDSGRLGWTTEADLLDGRRTDEEAVGSVIDSPNSRLLVVDAPEGSRASGPLLGCCRVDRHAGLAHFGMFAVAPLEQGSGLGSALLAEAERIGRDEWRLDAMELECLAPRSELLAFYERRGYVATGERRPFPYDDPRFGIPRQDGLEFLVLTKDLRPGRPGGTTYPSSVPTTDTKETISPG